ncbi:MAG: hypothetical protein K5696_11395 [Lachnospiraceae bacterium]|nr:hypothetical protein [Lachnospiraceae bacterium]
MDGIIVGVIIAAIVAGIVVAIMVGQMKPVARKHEAAQYIGEGDVKISVQEDTYLRTELRRRKLENKQSGGKEA